MSIRARNAKKTKGGQTLIEFALVSVIFIFLLVLTFNAILAFSVQQYLSYAAFMAARAYQAAGGSPEDQASRAREMLRQYIPGLPAGNTENFGSPGQPIQFSLLPRPVAFLQQIQIPNPQPGDEGAGVPDPPRAIRLVFNMPLAQIPLGEVVRERLGLIRLEAQSFLGREVSVQECRGFFRGFLSSYRIPGAPPNHQSFVTNPSSSELMEDNGC